MKVRFSIISRAGVEGLANVSATPAGARISSAFTAAASVEVGRAVTLFSPRARTRGVVRREVFMVALLLAGPVRVVCISVIVGKGEKIRYCSGPLKYLEIE